MESNRLKGDKRYFLRTYDFLDGRLNRLTEHLEDRMPHFLQQVGGELFSLRNSCARVIDDWTEEKKTTFNLIMHDWSKLSEETIKKIISLISNKSDSPEKADTIMLSYIELCFGLDRLNNLLGENVNNLMSGDLF